MPKFTVKTPDGKTYTVNAPEGATHEDAINHVKEKYYSIQTSMQKKDAGIVDSLANSPLGGFVRGLRDIPDAGAQLLTRGLEAVAPRGSQLEAFAKSEREKVEAINKAAEQDYAQNWRQGQDTGLDIGRIGGSIAATYPVSLLVPGAAAATLPGRMASGAGVGAITGAMQPVKDGKDFWGEKAAQTGIGAIAGGLSVPLAEKISKIVANAANKIGARFTPAQSAQIQQGLAQEGVDFSKLSQQAQESILKEADDALKAGGQLDFKAIARKADFEKVGIKPTLGQLTGDPMQYQFEQNSRGIVGGGESLSQRFNEQNTGLVDAINRMKQSVGGSGDPYTGAVNIQEGLRKLNEARRAGVSNLYDIAKNQPGRFAQLNPHRFTNDVNNILDKELGGYALPEGVRNKLNKIALGDAPFGIQEAEQLKKIANQYWDKTGQDGAKNFALAQFKDAVNREITNSADDLAKQAKLMSSRGMQAEAEAAKKTAQSFKIATKAAMQQKNTLDKVPGLKFAVDNDMPDPKFVEKFVINARPRELLNMRAQLKNSPDVWQEVRGQVIEQLKKKALGGQLDEFAKFSQSGFKNGLNTIGEARLKILFSPAEISELKSIQRVASAIQVQPVGSAVNNSGTSQAIVNLLDRLSNVPYLKELAINPLRNFQLQGQVNNALNPGAGVISKPATIPPEIISRYNRAAAVSAYPLLQGMTQ